MPWDFSDAHAKDAKLSRAVAEMQQPMAEAVVIIREAIADNFAGEWDGEEHWKQLAPRTVQDRIAKGYPGSHPILERSGDLKNSMKDSSDNDSAEVGPSEDIPYAGVHADGSADGKIPQRDYLRLNPRDEDRIEEKILDWLERNEG